MLLIVLTILHSSDFFLNVVVLQTTPYKKDKNQIICYHITFIKIDVLEIRDLKSLTVPSNLPCRHKTPDLTGSLNEAKNKRDSVNKTFCTRTDP